MAESGEQYEARTAAAAGSDPWDPERGASAPGANRHRSQGGGYVPAVIPPDPARDARVAARRAEDARRAGAGLDRLLAEREPTDTADAYNMGWREGYLACELHHNRHYDVAACHCTIDTRNGSIVDRETTCPVHGER